MDATQTATTRPTTTVIALIVAAGVLTGLAILFGERALGGPTAAAPMTAVGVAVVCYLAAAATGIRWMAWLWVPIGTLLIGAAVLLRLPRPVLLVAAAVVLLVIGLVRRPAPTGTQALAMLGYLGVAVAALFLAPRLGLAVAAIALIAHAGWDLVHYRRNVVVDRSLALWCMGLDVALGGACLVFAVAG